MKSTVTLNELSDRLLDSGVTQALSSAELEVSSEMANYSEMSVDELAEKFLDSQVRQSLPKVDLQVQEFGAGIEIHQFRAHIHTQSLSLTLFVIAVASLGIGLPLALLQVLLGG